MQHVIDHFQQHDPIMHRLIVQTGAPPALQLVKPEKFFYHLSREIVAQQLASKAATAIFTRFQNLFTDGNIVPAAILAIPHDELRGVGLSHAKARYLRYLATAVTEGELNLEQLPALDNEEVIAALTQVKGIGRWTAEMFLMFAMGRENIFSHGDLGLKRAMQKWYEIGEKPTREEVESIATQWQPYQTYACLVLWRSLDT